MGMVNVDHLSRMVENRPCQVLQPWLPQLLLLLLLLKFCCCCWMEPPMLAEIRFLLGKSSAAILVQSERQPGHGNSGTQL